MQVPNVLNDEQIARVVVATLHFGLRKDGYFISEANSFKNGNPTGAVALRRQNLRKHMANITRRVASELDAHADRVIKAEIDEACRNANLPTPNIDANWLAFVINGKAIENVVADSPSEVIAVNIINKHISTIVTRVRTAPNKAMEPIKIASK